MAMAGKAVPYNVGSLGRALAAARRTAGLSLEEAADRLQLKLNALVVYESSGGPGVGADFILRAAKAYDDPQLVEMLLVDTDWRVIRSDPSSPVANLEARLANLERRLAAIARLAQLDDGELEDETD